MASRRERLPAPVGPPGVSRIRCIGIDGFYDIIGSVERFIPDQLNLHGSVGQLFHNENGEECVTIQMPGMGVFSGMKVRAA